MPLLRKKRLFCWLCSCGGKKVIKCHRAEAPKQLGTRVWSCNFTYVNVDAVVELIAPPLKACSPCFHMLTKSVHETKPDSVTSNRGARRAAATCTQQRWITQPWLQGLLLLFRPISVCLSLVHIGCIILYQLLAGSVLNVIMFKISVLIQMTPFHTGGYWKVNCVLGLESAVCIYVEGFSFEQCFDFPRLQLQGATSMCVLPVSSLDISHLRSINLTCLILTKRRFFLDPNKKGLFILGNSQTNPEKGDGKCSFATICVNSAPRWTNFVNSWPALWHRPSSYKSMRCIWS